MHPPIACPDEAPDTRPWEPWTRKDWAGFFVPIAAAPLVYLVLERIGVSLGLF